MAAATESLFLVASNIHFSDDMSLPRFGTSTRLLAATCSCSSTPCAAHAATSADQAASVEDGDALEPQDDVFYLSRLNDPTTYFFQWICKRYGLTVKAEPHSCPICLETSENSIQLSCGHTFCRQCLKAAAEQKMSSCALCRKSHTLDPDVLRQQFQTQRFANMSWRLGNTRATRVFSKPSWEALFCAGSGGAGNAGKCSDVGDRASSPSCEAGEVPTGGGGSVGVTKGKGGKERGRGYVGPDIGGLPHRLLMRRAAKSVRRAFVSPDPDVGGSTRAELQRRWSMLMGGKAAESKQWKGGVAVLTEEAGAESVAGLTRRWGRGREGQGGQADCMGSRWSDLMRQGQGKEGGVGGEDQAALTAWWREARGQESAEVGAAKVPTLAAAWSLLVPDSPGPLAPWAVPTTDCGGLSVAALKARAQRLFLPPVIDATSDAGVGALAQEEMQARWDACFLSSRATLPCLDAGGRDVAELAHRWGKLMDVEVGEEVGGKPWAALAARWEERSMVGADREGGDVGGLDSKTLKTQWATTNVGGKARLTEEAGACGTEMLECRWGMGREGNTHG